MAAALSHFMHRSSYTCHITVICHMTGSSSLCGVGNLSLYKDRNLCISKTKGGRRRWCQQLKCLCFCFLAFLLGFFLLVLCFYVLHTHVQHNAFCLLGKQFFLFPITLCQWQIVKISRVSEQDLFPLWRVAMLAVLFLVNLLSEFFLHFQTLGTCGLI